MLNLVSLVHRAGSVASALSDRGVSQEVVDEALRLLLGLPDRPAAATPAAAPPPAPPPAAGGAPPEEKKTCPKAKVKPAAPAECDFGPSLRRAIARRGLKHREFAEKAGLKKGAAGKAFQRVTAKPATVARYAAALGMTPAELWPAGNHARRAGAGNGGPLPGGGEAGDSDGESGQPWERCRPPPGVDPGHFRAVAEQIHRHAKEYREQMRRVLSEAREMYRRETGRKLTNMHRLEFRTYQRTAARQCSRESSRSSNSADCGCPLLCCEPAK